MKRRAASSDHVGHRPVMLAEVLAALSPREDGRYIDGTFGGGGHTRALLNASAPGGLVLAIDADHAAIARGAALTETLDDPHRLTLRHGNFRDLARYARDAGMTPVDGVLLDLGLSSFQLDTAERGFAFRIAGPLDMRFDVSQGESAATLVNRLPARELADLIYAYGEEPKSRRIAAAIVRERAVTPIETTDRLAEIVARAAGGRRTGTHPATRTFQALRIATNAELEVLPDALAGAIAALGVGGRLAIISFHSLEDRMVKRFIAHEAATCVCPPEQPVCSCGKVARLRRVGGAVRADAAEVAANPRARSAVLRVAERIKDTTVTSVAGGASQP